MRKKRSSRQLYRDFRQEVRAARQAKNGEGKKGVDREKRREYLREYRRFLWPFRWAIVSVCVLALFSAALSLVLPRATMYIIDEVLQHAGMNTGGKIRLLHVLGITLLLIVVVQQCIELLRNWRTAKLNARIVFRLRQRLYEHLLRQPLHELAAMKTGGITSRLSGDIDALSAIVQMAIITPGVALVKVLLTAIILLTISWKLVLAASVLLPILVGLNLAYMRRIRPIYSSMRRDRGEIDGRVVETFGGIRVVHAFSREKTESLRYAIRHHAVIRKLLRAQFLQHVVWSGWGFIIPVAGLIIVWFGGVLYLKGQATIGGIVAFQMYLAMMLMPVSMIIRSYGELQQALAAMERVFDLLRKPADKPDVAEAIPAPERVETIELDDVTFTYPQVEEVPATDDDEAEQGAKPPEEDAWQPAGPVLKSVSLHVPGGSTVALVGPSGSGKTTFTNLVARFYDPDEGTVRLNGIDLREIKLRSYRRLLGLVQQDVFLFDGTIAENIAYGRPGADEAAIIDAARRANAHDFIIAFPEGYDTLVGERGVRLSGGQAQRISIARAILADPQILILDEATSNLDSESEQLIQASMHELLADRTTFVIAHRLSTVVSADVIVVLAAGEIVESGTHDELMAAEGLYHAMVQRQQYGADDSLEAADLLS